MARFISNNKIYDTSKAEQLVEQRWYEKRTAKCVLGEFSLNIEIITRIWRTKKGTYFKTEEDNKKIYFLGEMKEKEVKELLSRKFSEKYLEIFGTEELEEA